jgi:hypothetical protein
VTPSGAKLSGDRLHALLTGAIAEGRQAQIAVARKILGVTPVATAPRELKRPIELAALKGRLERAQKAEAAIGTIGVRYDTVLGAIEEKTEQAKRHVEHLENYDGQLGALIASMIGDGSNSDDPAKKVDGQRTDGAGTETKQENA